MIFDKNHDVYITYLPDENSDNVVNTAKKLKEEGYEVIPHLPARTIANENELEKYVGELANKSGCSKILIIGGGGNQAGNIASTMDVLKQIYYQNLITNLLVLQVIQKVVLIFQIKT